MSSTISKTTSTTAVCKLKLPHPYLTTYLAVPADEESYLKIILDENKSNTKGKQPPFQLHNGSVSYQHPTTSSTTSIDPSNNSAWATAKRAPQASIKWSNEVPSLAQVWLIIYMIFTQSPNNETFRLDLSGRDQDTLSSQLRQSTLAIQHPAPSRSSDKEAPIDQLLILRSTFWQGAASPIGQRSAWIPSGGCSSNIITTDYTMTTKIPSFNQVHAYHPRRSSKPIPGTTVFSRYIPSLDEHFSMISLDYTNAEHLNLFHTWQNDPRVAAGWNETGDLDHHQTYLKDLHEDPHVLTVLAYFDETPFAYFEIYWAAEDHLGAHYKAGDFDRGRHALVGNPNFRGRHRVNAWWSATIHYIFLDDPRTMQVVGEPKFVNTSVLAYDLMHGFGVNKFVDLGHKRSALMTCSRERYFQLGIDVEQEGVVGGTRVAVGVPKL